MKYLIMILFTLLFCGCSVDYQIQIDKDNQVFEQALIKSTNESESEEIHNYNWPIKVFYDDPDIGENPEEIEGVSYYKSELISENNLYHKKLTNQYTLEEFAKINFVNSCYEHFYVTEEEEENQITLSTSPKFLCLEDYPELDTVNVRIQVENPVLSHNAMNVDGNVYEWQITKENYENSGIIISFMKENKIKEQKNSMYIIIGGFVVFLIIIISIVYFKMKH